MLRSAAAILVVALCAGPASAATAYWTGRSEQVQTVTYKWVWRCEYNYIGHGFGYLSRLFAAVDWSWAPGGCQNSESSSSGERSYTSWSARCC